MQPPLDQSVTVVTGASSGIGVELARLLCPRCDVLVLVARRRERLEALAAELRDLSPKVRVEVRPCDLSEVDAVDALAKGLIADHGRVDVLVNNAGMGDLDLFERCDPAKLLTMLQVNMVGLTLLTRALLPPMLEARAGGVLNISSSFGLTWMPNFSAYAGTKHYVTAFTEALRCELLGTGVVVTQVCPGPVSTEFEEVAGVHRGLEVPAMVQITPEHCAEAALAGFERGRALVIPGFWMKLIMLLDALTPRFLLRLVMGLVGRMMRLELEGHYAVQAANQGPVGASTPTGQAGSLGN